MGNRLVVVALVAAIFAFGGIANASAGIERILFFIFIALLVIGVMVSLMRGRSPL